jgi:hypothetical protein
MVVAERGAEKYLVRLVGVLLVELGFGFALARQGEMFMSSVGGTVRSL